MINSTVPKLKKEIEKASEKEQKILKSTLGNKTLSTKQIHHIREIIVRTGSLEYSKKSARLLAEKAKQIIRRADIAKEAKTFLKKIADYVVERVL